MSARLSRTTARIALVFAGTATAAALSSVSAFAATPALSGTPSSGLKDGTSVALTGTGYTPNLSLFVLECSSATGGQAACDITHLGMATSSASGAVSTSFTVHTGTIGNGTCDATHTGCVIQVADAAGTSHAAFPLVFGGTAAAATPAASAAPTTSTAPAATSTAAAPTTVAAGSGGTADRGSSNVELLALVGLGGVALVGTTIGLARRRS